MAPITQILSQYVDFRSSRAMTKPQNIYMKDMSSSGANCGQTAKPSYVPLHLKFVSCPKFRLHSVTCQEKNRKTVVKAKLLVDTTLVMSRWEVQGHVL